ncbi:DNA (cytosine-5-)-methyltransferase [Siminovitchia sp. 179-K 8D1 HS]|uniref:DNA (cytosine-5-)-methyltransferase n=1 Tax=Siminovitchia sp. 179-K 8D1 HS TaxID=3142385 RepID=UPI0039A2FB5D
MKFTYFELFAGSGVGGMALDRYGGECIGYSEIDPYAIKNYNANFPGRTNFGSITEINEKELPDFDLVIGGSPCFEAGTLVMTDKGYKKIEDIKKGDRVLTHSNTFQRVVIPMMKYTEEIYEVKTFGTHGFKVTEEHPFYTRERYTEWNNTNRTYERKFHEPKWINTNELNENHYIGVAINNKSEIPNWSGVVYEQNQFTNKLRNNLDLSNEKFWWFVGRFIGDGWLSLHKRKNRQNSFIYKTVLCCAKSEIDEVKPILDDLFNYTLVEERTVYKFQITNLELFKYLEQFGKGAKNKKLTSDVFNLPIDLLKSFLDGYISADGSKKEKHISATTVSKELAYGIQACVNKAYKRPCSLYEYTPPSTTVIEGRVVNQSPGYIVRFKQETSKQDKAFYENGFIWIPFKEKRKIPYDGYVYNMEVEHDNSYTVYNLIVHNCQNISIANNTNGVTGLKGEESKLFYDYLRILNHKKPKWFIFENVRNLFSSNGGEDWKIVKQSFGENYNIKFKLMNTADYGLPQTRQRIYVVGQRKDLGEFNYTFPKEEGLTITVFDLLENKVDDKYYLSEKMYNYAMGTGTKSFKHKPKTDLEIACPLLATMHKMHRAGISNYYHTDYRPQNKTNLRKLTPRECARLQGLPDTYEFVVSNTQAYRLMGNAMSLNVVEKIVKQLFKSNL